MPVKVVTLRHFWGKMRITSAQIFHRHVENYPDVVQEQLGLQNSWDTLVGVNLVRGVSGGEKKRVTTGEMVLGMQAAVFMDKISTGLDSAATIDIIHTQCTNGRALGKTMVISLLQPAPDVFALFDSIIRLNEGHALRSRVVFKIGNAGDGDGVHHEQFMDASPTNVPLVLGVLFMSGMTPLFEQTSQLSMFIEMRDVFYTQRPANFFETSAYVLANVISQVPVALPEGFVFGAFQYWIGDLEASAGSFIVYELVVFLIVMAAVLIFFFVAAISPNIYATNPLALGIPQVILVFLGFIVTKEQIPAYLFCLYWLSPMPWGFRALAVNQYRSAAFDVCIYEDVDYCDQFGKTMGEYYLGVYSIQAEKEWVVFGIVYLVGLTLVFMLLTYLALEYKCYEGDFRVVRSKAMGGNDEGHNQLSPPACDDSEGEQLNVTPRKK